MTSADHTFTPGRAVARHEGRTRAQRRATYQEMRAEAQQFGIAAIHKLAYMAEHSLDERVQVLCCKELLDRAYGRPPDSALGQQVEAPKTIDGECVDVTDVAGLSEAELKERLDAALRKVQDGAK